MKPTIAQMKPWPRVMGGGWTVIGCCSRCRGIALASDRLGVLPAVVAARSGEIGDAHVGCLCRRMATPPCTARRHHKCSRSRLHVTAYRRGSRSASRCARSGRSSSSLPRGRRKRAAPTENNPGMLPTLGREVSAPHVPHFVHRAQRRSLLLDVFGPHRMIRGAIGMAALCRQWR